MTAIDPPDHKASPTARANPETGEIVATAVFATGPERLFQALTTPEICDWWVRPGVFDTREWTGELRTGGTWRASGLGGGQPYALEGEFVEINSPWRLVHTWHAVGAPGGPALVTYDLEQLASGVRLTLRHSGMMNPDILEKTRAGWVTSFTRLREILGPKENATPL